MSNKVCRVCGQPLSHGETRCSYCGTTTEDYEAPKYTSSYYSDTQQSPWQQTKHEHPSTHDATRVINSYANRPNSSVDINRDAVVIRNGSQERVYPTRIDPQATHAKAKKQTSVWKIILPICIVLAIFFSIVFVAIIGGIADNIDTTRGEKELNRLSQQAVGTEYVDQIDDEYVTLGEPVEYFTNLYSNGKFSIYNLIRFEFVNSRYTDVPSDSYYREYFVFLNSEYLKDASIRTDEYEFNSRGDVNISCSTLVYDMRFDYFYLPKDSEIKRNNDLVINDLKFEVYEVSDNFGSYKYCLFAEPIEKDEGILYIEVSADKPVDYSDVISHVVYGRQESE